MFCVGCRSRAAEGARDRRRQPVTHEGPPEQRVEITLGHRADRFHVARVLRDEHEDGGDHEQDGAPAEVRQLEVG